MMMITTIVTIASNNSIIVVSDTKEIVSCLGTGSSTMCSWVSEIASVSGVSATGCFTERYLAETYPYVS